MSRTARIAAVYVALAAIMLRAFLPAGWMPSQTPGVPLVICTMQGPVRVVLDQHGKPQKQDTQHTSEACPFAAAPSLSTPTVVAAIVPPSLHIAFVEQQQTRAVLRTAQAHTPQSLRGPPNLA